MTSVSKRRAGSTERRFRGALRLVATLGIEHPLDALDGLLRVPGVAEGSQADVALAGRPEPGAGGGDDVGLFQKAVEEVPGAGAVRGAAPHVRAVVGAVHLKAGRRQALLYRAGVGAVEVDRLVHLGRPLRSVDGRRAPLDDVGGAVELGGLAAVPHGV